MNPFLVMKVNSYIDLIGIIVKELEYTRFTSGTYQYLMKDYYTKEDYNILKNRILHLMLKCCEKISDLNAFRIAVFSFRSGCKLLMYNTNSLLTDHTLNYKMYNKLCSVSLNASINNFESDSINEHKNLQYLFNLAYIFYYNMDFLNRKLVKDCNEEDINLFCEKIAEVSSRKGDMHTYKIKNEDIKFFLKDRHMDENTFQKNMRKYIGDRYISVIERIIDITTERQFERGNLSHKLEDIIILSEETYKKIKNKRLKDFFDIFSINRHCDLDKDENELTFTFYDLDKNIYISRQIMQITQEIIEAFIRWCQYTKLISYYYNFEKIKENKNHYNRIMTYKIADLLLVNKYILPIDKKTENGKKIAIPKIEIDKLVKGVNQKELGDYDILFYSPYTKTLYNLEYKNYQMIITEEGCYSKEIEKVKKDNVVNKSLNREQYLSKNLQVVLDNIFKKMDINVENIETIILTTKPNLYFYVNEQKDFYYYEWNEFKDKVENHLI